MPARDQHAYVSDVRLACIGSDLRLSIVPSSLSLALDAASSKLQATTTSQRLEMSAVRSIRRRIAIVELIASQSSSPPPPVNIVATFGYGAVLFFRHISNQVIDICLCLSRCALIITLPSHVVSETKF